MINTKFNTGVLKSISDIPSFKPQPKAMYYNAWGRKSDENLEGRRKLFPKRPCFHKEIMLVTTHEAPPNTVLIHQKLNLSLYEKCSLIEFNRREPALLRISNHSLINIHSNFIKGISKKFDVVLI